jgi:hypothetical protein
MIAGRAPTPIANLPGNPRRSQRALCSAGPCVSAECTQRAGAEGGWRRRGNTVARPSPDSGMVARPARTAARECFQLCEEVLDIPGNSRVRTIGVRKLRVQVRHFLVEQESDVGPTSSPNDNLRLVITRLKAHAQRLRNLHGRSISHDLLRPRRLFVAPREWTHLRVALPLRSQPRQPARQFVKIYHVVHGYILLDSTLTGMIGGTHDSRQESAFSGIDVAEQFDSPEEA